MLKIWNQIKDQLCEPNNEFTCAWQLSYISYDDAISGNMVIKQSLTGLLSQTCTMKNLRISSSNAQFRRKAKTISHKASLSSNRNDRSFSKILFVCSVNASLHDIWNCAIFIREYYYWYFISLRGNIVFAFQNIHWLWYGYNLYGLVNLMSVHYVSAQVLYLTCAMYKQDLPGTSVEIFDTLQQLPTRYHWWIAFEGMLRCLCFANMKVLMSSC